MKTRKKAELSINIIIVAVIALLVLVVVSFIFMEKIREFVFGIKDCKSSGGECYYGDSCPGGSAAIPKSVCHGENDKADSSKVCCTQSLSGA
jgi:hypothetical protein